MFAIVKILCLYKIECVKAIPMSSFKRLHDTPYTKNSSKANEGMLFVSSLYLTSNQGFVSVYFAEHFFTLGFRLGAV